MRQTLMRPGVAQTLPYSHGVIAAGRVLFISGQGPVDPATGAVVEGSIEEQTRLTLDNLAAIAALAGADLSRAVKVNVFLADVREFARFNAVYAERFPADRPARTTVQATLPLPGMKIEIEATLALDD